MTPAISPAGRRGARPVGRPRLSEPRAALSISCHLPGTPGRVRLEAFVASVFQQAYGARITAFYPELLGVTRPDAGLAAVAGVRAAGAARLFAETYLDAPVETLIARRLDRSVARASVVEVGNLAPEGAGQARWLIAALTAYLAGRGFEWVVFTAVPALHNAFARMGLQPLALAPADPRRLPEDERAAWGRYYAGDPLVYFGSIQEGYRALNAGIEPAMPRLSHLWHDALRAAREAAVPALAESVS